MGGALPARDWPEDKRKVHAEITQLVNQRFLLTSGAVGVVALFVGRVIPDLIQGKPETVNALPVLSLGIVILVWILFEQSHWLRGMLRTLSTYLIAKNWSEFEADWQRFRLGGEVSIPGGLTPPSQKDPAPDIRSHSLVFYALILVTTGGPILLRLERSYSAGKPWREVLLNRDSRPSVELLLFVLGLCLCIRVWRVSRASYWNKRERRLAERWKGFFTGSSKDKTA